MHRRDFLKRTALAAASLSVPAVDASPFAGTLRRPAGAKRIIVIGAGLAGLSAAYELSQAGHDVTILEARTRPGGRVHTLRDSFADGLYVDAGATRIPNHHHFTLAYAELFGLTLEPFEPGLPSHYHVRGKSIQVAPGANVEWPYDLTPDERVLGLNGMRQKYVWSMLDEVGDVTDPNWPSPEMLKKYDRLNRSDFWQSRGASPEAVALMTLGSIDDRAETWSTLFMLRYQALNRKFSRFYKIKGGTDLLPKAFATRLSDKIRYGAPVVRVEQDSRGVKAIFQQAGVHHTLTGDRLICAVPFTVQKNIEAVPPFSVEKQLAIEQLPYMSVSKIFLQARKRFWTTDGLSGFATTDLPVSEVWDVTYKQPGTRGILQALPMGLHSRRVTGMPDKDRISFALEQVETIFPGMRENFESGFTKCWDEDEWARGAWCYYKPGQFSWLMPHVAKPEAKIHFAGEHTSIWLGGWMQGALESGNRVAREINDAS